MYKTAIKIQLLKIKTVLYDSFLFRIDNLRRTYIYELRILSDLVIYP